jgi:XTP/dITP diphosphohydrolase
MNSKREAGVHVAPQLVLATGNRRKLAELVRILAAGRVAVRTVGLADFPGAPDVRETGATFAENALLKGRAIAEFTGHPAVAEDSGLCVDALNGMPGVLSARWSGTHGDDAANLALVLAQLADVPDGRRGAHFTCAAALVLPDGREHVSEGTVHGRLIREARGTNGFGYDPIFVPDSAAKPVSPGQPADGQPAAARPAAARPAAQPAAELTTGEMAAAAKDAISHRGRALRGLAPVIAALLG